MIKICFTCWNIGKKGKGCPGCGRVIRYQVKEKTPKEIGDEGREEFLRAMWKKLKMFKMDSCGSPETDRLLREKYGEWK